MDTPMFIAGKGYLKVERIRLGPLEHRHVTEALSFSRTVARPKRVRKRELRRFAFEWCRLRPKRFTSCLGGARLSAFLSSDISGGLGEMIMELKPSAKYIFSAHDAFGRKLTLRLAGRANE